MPLEHWKCMVLIHDLHNFQQNNAKTYHDTLFYPKLTKRTGKNKKIGNLIIPEKLWMSKVAKIWENFFFTQMSITSSKIMIFELAKNENWNSNIFPQTGFSQFWILAFKNFWDPMEKSHFFQKKAKNPNFKIPSISKKKLGKSSSTKFLYPLGWVNVQKISQIGDGLVTGRLVDSYKKSLLRNGWNWK
jgi:hypothetical protein